MDEEREVDPQRASLEEAIALLKRLRQHRQARAERQQREASQVLQCSRERLVEAQTHLDSENKQQRQRRAELAEENLRQSMTLDDVDRWHNRERRMIDQLSLLRHDINRQHALIEEQHVRLQQACTVVSEAQRAVEKLACLTEALNDES